jgi:TonB family protein
MEERRMRFPIGLLLLTTALSLVGQGQPILNEDIGIFDFVPLDYPLVAKINHVQGAVVVRVKVDSKGNVTSAMAISGPKQLISDSLSNAKKWRFQPEKSREVVIVYIFKFEGLCQLPCKSLFSFSPPNMATITTGDAVVDHN